MLPAPAADPLAALAADAGGPPDRLSGPVFRTRGEDGRAVGYRMARLVVERACRRAGLPPMESVALRAACAHWLRTQGLSDHEVAKVLGLDRVRSLDRLLQPHTGLDAQRAVRELLDR